MLSPVQIEILEAAARSSGYVYAGVNPDGTPSGRYNALRALSGLGYVEVDAALQVLITPAGVAALIDAQQDLEKAAQQIADQRAADDRKQKSEKRKQRSEWARFWIGLILGWLLGALTPLDLLNLGARLIAWLKGLFV